jgi:hypothetical protein
MCRASLLETVTEQSATAVLLATTKEEKNNEIHCLGYIEPGKFEGMTEDERNAVFDECFEYNDHLRANGHLVAEVPLQPPETALTVYRKNGKVATTDGPMRKPRNNSAAFSSLRRETSIMLFSFCHSIQAA